MDTCLIIDDHVLFSHSLSYLLKATFTEAKIEHFTNTLDALVWIRSNEAPDLVLLDIHLGKESGIRFLRDIENLDFPPPVLVISSDTDIRKVDSCIEHGANGFVSKSAEAETLIKAVKTILEQGEYFCDSFRPSNSELESNIKFSVHAFSGTQKRIIWYLQQGLPNKVIADRMNLSEHTVKYHLANLYRQLGAKNRTECLMQAQKQGLF